MARMIPPLIPADTPAGEKLMLRKLKEDPSAKDWVVFHSVDIRKHFKRLEGEADLVVVVPGYGVLCIEVKGCDVSRRDGVWIYPYGSSPVGPFRQAGDAAHSLRRYVGERDASVAGLLFYSAVAFTTINFAEKSPEWHPWQVVNKTDLIRSPISTLLQSILVRAHEICRARMSPLGWYQDRTSRPTTRQADRLVQLLRSDFEYVESAKGSVEIAEDAIRRFTQEQFDAIDHLEENRCILFKGPAGTGKTFLAVEAARRAIRAGKGAALFCFNSLLGDWLNREMQGLAAEAKTLGVPFFAGTLHSFMLSIAGLQVPENAGSKFWQLDLPEKTVEVLLEGKQCAPLFDLLLVDEAQDLLNIAYLDVLELVLMGGFSGGRWAMFGDFERQAIYLRPAESNNLDSLRHRAGEKEVVTFSLRVNCRNAERISETLTITTGMSPGYSRVLSALEAADVEPVFYKSTDDQKRLLVSTIDKLLRSFRPDQIVVLSMRADSSSAAAQISGIDKNFHLVPYRSAPGSTLGVRFTTIHAFKGLESAAIILTDVDRIDDDHSRSLLYVGMSRARIQLHILMSDRVRSSYAALLDSGFKVATGRIA
jgi:RecA/RadA recombinase